MDHPKKGSDRGHRKPLRLLQLERMQKFQRKNEQCARGGRVPKDAGEMITKGGLEADRVIQGIAESLEGTIKI